MGGDGVACPAGQMNLTRKDRMQVEEGGWGCNRSSRDGEGGVVGRTGGWRTCFDGDGGCFAF